MKQHLVRYALGLAVLFLLLGHSARVFEIDLIGRLDAIFYDAKLRLTMPAGVDERIAIVDIDEKALAAIGRWPWGRHRLAELVDRLVDRHGAAVVGFDVVLAEADHSSGLGNLEALSRQELKDLPAFRAAVEALRPRLDYDARFAQAIKGRPVILGFYFSSLAGGVNAGELPKPTLPAGAFQGRPVAFTEWSSYGANLAAFQQFAGGGHINSLPDVDGISRRVPMLAEYRGQYYESLSLAVVRLLAGMPRIVPGYPEDRFLAGRAYAGLEWLDLATAEGNLRIPVDENAAALIPYRGHQGSYLYVSAADVLQDRLPPDTLRGRVVLVGTTAPGLLDLRATPVGAAYPGVEIHANLVAGILDGRVKHRPAYVLGADVLLMVIAGGIMVFVLPLLSPVRAALAASAVFAGLVVINLAFWQYGNLVLPLANSLLLVGILFGLNMSWGFFVESRTKRQFTELFGQYVPPELVDEMARDPESYSMEGRKADLTVLFSDIRGFTSFAEAMPPDQLAALMNEYLGTMTAVVRHQRGTLDKYMGDAVMAFWGAPVDDQEHARHAVLTALAMQAAMPELNARLAARGWPHLTIGIGVNTGNMTVGDMGSALRKAYTVLGDAVNLGARLEGLTKEYGVGIIVGEATREPLKKSFVFRELDRVRVKGKDEPVSVFEPIGVEGAVAASLLEELKLWHQALRSYRARDWDQAEVALLNLGRMAPRELYEMLGRRIVEFRRRPPADDWDGAWTFASK